MSIYAAFTGKSFEDIENEFAGKGYGDFKLAVGETVADALAEIQGKYNLFISDKEQLNKILIDGAQKASYTAEKSLRKVYRKVGFYSVK
jgi:tryptophanyl-tRNA synthetase